MNIINLFFFILITYLTTFVSYIFIGDFNKKIESYLKLSELYNAIPFGNNLILTICFIMFTLLVAIYYKLFKKFSPRWRVYSANKMIKKLRKGIADGNYSKNQCLSYLKKIDPFIFEELLLSLFFEKGFKIKRNKRYTGDGGSDGLVWISGHKTHIQAKRYKSYISKAHMQEFAELIIKEKTLGIFIHTGKTGKQTQEVADINSIDIISGNDLVDFVLGNNVLIFNKEYKKTRNIKNK